MFFVQLLSILSAKPFMREKGCKDFGEAKIEGGYSFFAGASSAVGPQPLRLPVGLGAAVEPGQPQGLRPYGKNVNHTQD
jgi:hypothetical protein